MVMGIEGLWEGSWRGELGLFWMPVLGIGMMPCPSCFKEWNEGGYDWLAG